MRHLSLTDSICPTIQRRIRQGIAPGHHVPGSSARPGRHVRCQPRGSLDWSDARCQRCWTAVGARRLQPDLCAAAAHRGIAIGPVRPATTVPARLGDLHRWFRHMRWSAGHRGADRWSRDRGCGSGTAVARLAVDHPRRMERGASSQSCSRRLGRLQRTRLCRWPEQWAADWSMRSGGAACS